MADSTGPGQVRRFSQRHGNGQATDNDRSVRYHLMRESILWVKVDSLTLGPDDSDEDEPIESKPP
jgi:hypothetical protein